MTYKGYDLIDSFYNCTVSKGDLFLSFRSVFSAMRYIKSVENGVAVSVWNMIQDAHRQIDGVAADFLSIFVGTGYTFKEAIEKYSKMTASDWGMSPAEISKELNSKLSGMVRLIVLHDIFCYTEKIEQNIYEDTASAVLLSVTVNNRFDTIDYIVHDTFKKLSGFSDWR